MSPTVPGRALTGTWAAATARADGFPTATEVAASTSVEQVLRWNRCLPSPRTDAQVKVIDAVVKRLGELRTLDNAAYVRASKSIGWD